MEGARADAPAAQAAFCLLEKNSFVCMYVMLTFIYYIIYLHHYILQNYRKYNDNAPSPPIIYISSVKFTKET